MGILKKLAHTYEDFRTSEEYEKAHKVLEVNQ